MKNKKGLSEVVTYVLLIVTALSLSVIVFGFLQGIVPEEEESCPEGLGLIIKEVSCESGDEIYVTFQNKGRFKIDGVYARFAYEEDAVASLALVPLHDVGNTGSLNKITEDNAGEGFMYFGRIYYVPSPLSPNANPYKQLFSYASEGSLEKIEVQPFLSDEERNLVICEDKSVSYEISCS